MIIARATWDNYTEKQRLLADEAADRISDYLGQHEIATREDRGNLIQFSYAVATKYGEGAAALSAQMYDEMAEAEGETLPAAEVAETATLDETARAVAGTLKTGNNDIVAGAVGRLVKMAGVDTTIKNALRDGAQWAWIPQGNETCAFCIMLASRGWQYASREALKNGHAEHIHPNCDCMYAVRFNDETNVEGYDPDKYLQMYEEAEGDTWKEKLNSLRRGISNNAREKVRIQKKEKPLLNVASPDEGAKIIKKSDRRSGKPKGVSITG